MTAELTPYQAYDLTLKIFGIVFASGLTVFLALYFKWLEAKNRTIVSEFEKIGGIGKSAISRVAPILRFAGKYAWLINTVVLTAWLWELKWPGSKSDIVVALLLTALLVICIFQKQLAPVWRIFGLVHESIDRVRQMESDTHAHTMRLYRIDEIQDKELLLLMTFLAEPSHRPELMQRMKEILVQRQKALDEEKRGVQK